MVPKSSVQNKVQAYLGDVAGVVPDHHNRASIMIKVRCNLFAGEMPGLPFVKDATSVEYQTDGGGRGRGVIIL